MKVRAVIGSVVIIFCSACSRSAPPAPRGIASAASSLPAAAECILRSPALSVGSTPELTIDGVTYTRSHQPDAPGPLERPIESPGPQPPGACRGQQGYRYGSGLYDTTGPVGGNPTGHADMAGHVVPPQVPQGIHTRLYARAFVIESPCNGKRVMFVSDDHAFPSGLLRQEVLKVIAADAALAPHYGAENLMLTSTHTHSAGGGFGEPTFLPALPPGTPQVVIDAFSYPQNAIIGTTYYDQDHFNAIRNGILQAIRRAHANLQAHPQAAPIRLSIGELLNASRSRDPLAYQQNSPAERARYTDRNGKEVQVDKRFLQLSFVRDNGSAVGVLNWFGVHPTAMGNHNLLISSDTKGYASLGFEKLMSTRYEPDAGDAPSGADNFVAAFAQSDEGNAVHDLYVFDKDLEGSDAPGRGVPYSKRFGTDDPFDFDQPGYGLGMRKAVSLFGTKQLAQALKQYGQGSMLSGGVDYRLFYVDMNDIAVTDPVILDQLVFADLPPVLYASEKTTCGSGSGIAFAGGAPNGLGPFATGYVCEQTAPVPYMDDARNHYNNVFNGTGTMIVYKNGLPLEVPFDGPAVTALAAPVLCLQRLQPKYSCQAEKPVLGEFSPEPVPLQIFRLGNLAILGVPFEVTTMAARRLRQTALDVLAPVGVDAVVIAGLANAYLDYLATREEYSAQMYEGASTTYGPWQLAATQQEVRRLALSLARDEPAPVGLTPPVLPLRGSSPITVDSPAAFGKTLVDVPAQAGFTSGETVEVQFVAGYPGNDLKLMSSYLFVERQNAAGAWEVVATDKDPELLFIWDSSPNPVTTVLHVSPASTVRALWEIPANTPMGTYRIRHAGVSRLAATQPPSPYEGMSREFKIAGATAVCP